MVNFGTLQKACSLESTRVIRKVLNIEDCGIRLGSSVG